MKRTCIDDGPGGANDDLSRHFGHPSLDRVFAGEETLDRCILSHSPHDLEDLDRELARRCDADRLSSVMRCASSSSATPVRTTGFHLDRRPVGSRKGSPEGL